MRRLTTRGEANCKTEDIAVRIAVQAKSTPKQRIKVGKMDISFLLCFSFSWSTDFFQFLSHKGTIPLHLFERFKDHKSSVCKSLFHPFHAKGLNQENTNFAGKEAKTSGVRSSA